MDRARFDIRVIGSRNDDPTSSRLSSVRAAATVITGIGVSPEAELERWRPDTIHVHNLFPYLGRRLRRATAPIVATAHNFRARCVNGYPLPQREGVHSLHRPSCGLTTTSPRTRSTRARVASLAARGSSLVGSRRKNGIDRLMAEWPADEPLRVVGDGPMRKPMEASSPSSAW